jgi:hypothetical protein
VLRAVWQVAAALSFEWTPRRGSLTRRCVLCVGDRNLVGFMSSGPIVAMELVAEGAVAKWRKLVGPTNSTTAKAEAPNSIRAHFGTDGTMNAVHGSDSDDNADLVRLLRSSLPPVGKHSPTRCRQPLLRRHRPHSQRTVNVESLRKKSRGLSVRTPGGMLTTSRARGMHLCSTTKELRSS